MKYIIIVIIILSFFSCQKNNTSKSLKKKKITKINTTIKKDIKKLIMDKNFKGKKYHFQKLSIIIPETFKQKNETLFFEENGTNLSFAQDNSNNNLHDYIENNFTILKKDFFNIIKEQEDLLINGRVVKYIKYIIDRKKFFIQIESILIRNKNTIYIVTISGKKKHISLLSKQINNIFSTIKLNESEENIIDNNK